MSAGIGGSIEKLQNVYEQLTRVELSHERALNELERCARLLENERAKNDGNEAVNQLLKTQIFHLTNQIQQFQIQIHREDHDGKYGGLFHENIHMAAMIAKLKEDAAQSRLQMQAQMEGKNEELLRLKMICERDKQVILELRLRLTSIEKFKVDIEKSSYEKMEGIKQAMSSKINELTTIISEKDSQIKALRLKSEELMLQITNIIAKQAAGHSTTVVGINNNSATFVNHANNSTNDVNEQKNNLQIVPLTANVPIINNNNNNNNNTNANNNSNANAINANANAILVFREKMEKQKQHYENQIETLKSNHEKEISDHLQAIAKLKIEQTKQFDELQTIHAKAIAELQKKLANKIVQPLYQSHNQLITANANANVNVIVNGKGRGRATTTMTQPVTLSLTTKPSSTLPKATVIGTTAIHTPIRKILNTNDNNNNDELQKKKVRIAKSAKSAKDPFDLSNSADDDDGDRDSKKSDVEKYFESASDGEEDDKNNKDDFVLKKNSMKATTTTYNVKAIGKDEQSMEIEIIKKQKKSKAIIDDDDYDEKLDNNNKSNNNNNNNNNNVKANVASANRNNSTIVTNNRTKLQFH